MENMPDEVVPTDANTANIEANNPAFTTTESTDVTTDQSTSNAAEAALTPSSDAIHVLAAEDAQQTVASKKAQGYNCPTCFGEGLIDEYTVCSTCQGTGKLPTGVATTN